MHLRHRSDRARGAKERRRREPRAMSTVRCNYSDCYRVLLSASAASRSLLSKQASRICYALPPGYAPLSLYPPLSLRQKHNRRGFSTAFLRTGSSYGYIVIIIIIIIE